MFYLVASCIALLLGPLFYRYFSSGSGLQKGLDGFIFVALGGLVLIHILPELLEHGGPLSLLFVVLGLWGPTASERVFHQYSNITHNITLTLGIAGLFLHTVTDGGAMVLAQRDDYSILLALGIILHRLPVGLAIWWLLKPQVGSRWASAVIASMIVLTCVGYFGSEQLLHHISLENTAYLQAFVTGSILHVVLHQPHGHHTEDKQGKYEYQAGIGSLLGLALLASLLSLETGGEHHHHSHGFAQLLEWSLLVSPYLILCYLAATLRYHLNCRPNNPQLNKRWLQRLIGPESMILTLALLGPTYGLLHFLAALLLTLYLTHQKVELTDPHSQLPTSAWQFGFAHTVDRSAPWIIFSLVVANVIGHPSVPLSAPWLQVAILLCVFIPLRFCNLGAAILAVSLALSGWTPIAIIFAVIAAPLINLAQCKLMKPRQVITSLFILMALVSVSYWVELPKQQALALPEWINIVSLTLVSLLFSASLLRVGPRQFLAKLMLIKQHKHHH
ncbi:metal transporter [Shewanella intestini]|uniref:Metal transporter n=1 Tax=Shewanella intestini TaxID=2017544 RepID=A0ABS5I5J7_9GAMM|nr:MULTISPECIES: metal transporter [Shewanella]MBR9729298.1 metal transporter [Shewanella intestini]MRG37377.1 metal transporter [Shewanella sp. XMDDZSB0408]